MPPGVGEKISACAARPASCHVGKKYGVFAAFIMIEG
jgi:hypothetical protein